MSVPAAPGVDAVRTLVARATLAPSTHNAQPWRWTVRPDHVELELDEQVARRLGVNDPERRELVMSCGAALMTLRVVAARALLDAAIDVLPDPHRPDLLAVVRLLPGVVDAAFATLDDVVALRHTAWGAFDDDPLPAGLAERLAAEALIEGAELTEVPPAARPAVADLLEHADHDRFQDPERRAELAGWVTSRWADEGRPPPGAPAVPAPVARAAMRRLDLGERIAAHDAQLLRQAPFIAVLATTGDGRADWLAAGQALQRVLLVAAEHGLCGGFLNAPCQIPADRERLRAALGSAAHPQVLLRLGRPLTRPVATPRRHVEEVVAVEAAPGHRARRTDLSTAREAGADFSEDALG